MSRNPRGGRFIWPNWSALWKFPSDPRRSCQILFGAWLLIGEWFDTLGDTITPHPTPHTFLVQRNDECRILVPLCVSEWAGWMGIGDAAGAGRGNSSPCKTKLSLPDTDWSGGWGSAPWKLHFFLPFYLVLGKFVDVHVNAWIREVWQQCSITVPLVGVLLSSRGETPLLWPPTISYKGTHFLSQTHIGKTRGEEEKGAEKKSLLLMRRNPHCWWEEILTVNEKK